ncbi:MAG: hypothetical protein Q7U73_07695 [Rubrivivax sp.]|nr:hypothetical protein [Rubrivivax sp.]
MKSPGEGTRPLSEMLRLAGAELQAQTPPPALQARVRAAVLAAPRAVPALAGTPQRHGWRGRPWVWSGAAVFASVLAATVLLLRLPPPLPMGVDAGMRQGEFVPVAPAERWPRGSAGAWLVATELQRERLPALGLPYDPARAGDTVRAELLLHPSGEVLAVRLIN